MEWNCIFIMKTQAIRKSNGLSIPAISCSIPLMSFPQILIWYNLSLKASATGQIVQNIKSILLISVYCLLWARFQQRMGSCLNFTEAAQLHDQKLQRFFNSNVGNKRILFISLLVILMFLLYFLWWKRDSGKGKSNNWLLFPFVLSLCHHFNWKNWLIICGNYPCTV